MTSRNDATIRQIQAARPESSTWLAANAGSGKTRVLTDRVARLLLGGVQPQHILCLTYTKAAASEMQNRLFQRLGGWAMLDDESLTNALVELGVEESGSGDRLRNARTLFARAIETPGGLKIQTIHSFCASLLRRFPLEAGVSPRFAEMEDRAAALLQAEIIEDFASGPELELIDGIAKHVTDTGFESLTRAIVHSREAFKTRLPWPELLSVLNLPPNFDEAELEQSVFLGDEAQLLADLKTLLKTGKSMDIKNASALEHIIHPKLSDLPVLEQVFLTGKKAKEPFSAKLGSFPTKDLRAAQPDLMQGLDGFMERVQAARSMRLRLICARKSFALHIFAAAFLPEYARRKQIRGWLDFDDLILKARQLLNDPSVAQWVLYRLDGGIDHILVDEAQDTSPVQWDVIEKLAQEFTSGIGSRADVERTIFVVGDKKQSIYSFQGADPEAFDRMQSEFSDRLENVGAGLQDLTLEFSFRSSDAILRLVDIVFKGQSDAGFPKDSLHRAFKSELPGRVDLWPAVQKVDDLDDRPWTDPVDRPSPRHHTVILAERIASSIRKMIDDKDTIPVDGKRPGSFVRRYVQPGDFLILVQHRSELFAEIIRACKAADLPIAGADRLKVGAELAVKDLAAVLSFLATPEDNLSLATVLKSPLFGWSEQDLFDLAHRRTGAFLWQSLRDRAGEFPEAFSVLTDLLGQADFLRPYDLLEQILTRHSGRQKLLQRLGPEAEDGVNALLSQALAYERSDIPSLTGFLSWMETDDLEIKRQMGTGGNMIRVMTVHGAKGLEAPIVILPDTGPRRPLSGGEIVLVNRIPVWRMNADQMPEALIDARDVARKRQMNERLRLLYVALTRAEKWLIVATAGDLDKNGESWYQLVQGALTEAGAETVSFDGELGLRLSHGDWDGLELRSDAPEAGHTVKPPGFLKSPIGSVQSEKLTLSPSDLGGAKALASDQGQDESVAMLRGERIHLLLEHLPHVPKVNWLNATANLLSGMPHEEQARLLDEVKNVLESPTLNHIFSAEALSEVSITSNVADRRLHGIIDRLVIFPDRILAVDYKTNMNVPDSPRSCPEGILRQMGAYALMLGQIYPDRPIETAILWTRTANLMLLPHDLVTDALLRSPSLDVKVGHS